MKEAPIKWFMYKSISSIGYRDRYQKVQENIEASRTSQMFNESTAYGAYMGLIETKIWIDKINEVKENK